MKVIDIIRKADVEIVAQIIGATVAMNTDNITIDEAMELDYSATLRYLQSDLEIDYKPTNADRIRRMSDEELAEFLCKVKADYQWTDQEFPREDECGEWENWLQEEYE